MYKIYFDGKRFNAKKFASYDAARNYLRRKLTQTFGKYQDRFGCLGFTIGK